MKRGEKRTLEQVGIMSSTSSSSSQSSGEEDERTIPFLRRLVEMIQENEDTISFYPGGTNGFLARIIVHDRVRIESDVLPRYFNHSSFASLRRQLNYFNFARIGRGRQRGATYINEAVVRLDDILRLKRREVGASSLLISTVKKHKVTAQENPPVKLPVSLDLTADQPQSLSSLRHDLVIPYDEIFACNILLALSCKTTLQQNV